MPAAGQHGGLVRIVTAGSVDDGKSTLIGRLLYDSKEILADQMAHIEEVSQRRGLDTVDLALRYLGLGAPEVVAADDQGRLLTADLERALAERDGPTLVCLQAGNVHSGAYDPFTEALVSSLQLALRIAEFFGLPVEAVFSLRPFPRIGHGPAEADQPSASRTADATSRARAGDSGRPSAAVT